MSGVNEITPVVVLTEYEPFVTETEVAVQAGAVSPVPHSRTEVGSSVISGSAVVSFDSGFFVCTTFKKSVEVSFTATGAAGAVTLGVIVALTYWPSSSTA